MAKCAKFYTTGENLSFLLNCNTTSKLVAIFDGNNLKG